MLIAWLMEFISDTHQFSTNKYLQYWVQQKDLVFLLEINVISDSPAKVFISKKTYFLVSTSINLLF